jgi:hypothetical protein
MNDDNNLQFVSICLGGRPDDAREIIEQPTTPKWNNMDGHFQMDFDSKEIMKSLLNFKTVPYYVVFDYKGKMIFSGTKLDMGILPGRRHCNQSSSVSNLSRINHTNVMLSHKVLDDCPAAHPIESDSESSMTHYDDDSSITTKMTTNRSTSPTRIFEIEDLDF